MSYCSWHTYGLGICLDSYTDFSVSKIDQLLSCAPGFNKRIQERFEQNGVIEPTIQDYEEYDDGYNLGMATIIKEVILEADGIDFTACDDLNGSVYIVYEPKYSWNLPQSERELSEERVREILAKYMRILTDNPINVEYFSIENGG